MDLFNVLVIGDIVGEPGRRACRDLIQTIRHREAVSFVVANGENSAGGSGITPQIVTELLGAGVDVITTGDHIFKKKEAMPMLPTERRCLRPANFPKAAPGFGWGIFTSPQGYTVGVINLLGRVFLQPVDCPFLRVSEILEEMRKKTSIIIIDMHAEATSEKVALGWYLDGKVSCIFGTHTHIQTADETVLPNGTGYITDVGMTGPYRSVLGRDINAVLQRFTTHVPAMFNVATDDIRLCGAIVSIDPETGKAHAIKRVAERFV